MDAGDTDRHEPKAAPTSLDPSLDPSLEQALEQASVPLGLNRALVVGVTLALWGLLAAASAVGPGLWLVPLAVTFALLFQTNFALLHEATHGVLATSSRENRLLGFVCGVVFPLSITLLTVTHNSHHDENRGAEERFDTVDTEGELPRRRLVWTVSLLGLWYLSIPLWCLALLVAPSAVRWFSERSRIGDRVFKNPRIVRRVRLELVLVLAAQALLWWLLALDVTTTLALSGAASSSPTPAGSRWRRRTCRAGASPSGRRLASSLLSTTPSSRP